MDCRDFERFFFAQRRQQARKAGGEHRLARAGRTDHQQTVPAGSGNLERPFGMHLAFDFGHIGVCRQRLLQAARIRREQAFAANVGAHFEKRSGGQDASVARQCGFGSVLRRQHKRAAAGGEGHRKRPAHRAKLTCQRQFADELMAFQRPGGELAARGKDPERDRQVEPARVLGQVGRRKIDRDAARGKLESGVVERCANAVLGFANFGIRQADDGERGQSRAEVNLDSDFRCADSDERAAPHNGERHGFSRARRAPPFGSTGHCAGGLHR